MAEPISLGMVGGGPQALIGPTHRLAARMDGEFRLVAGVFSRNAQHNSQMGRELRLDAGRVYANYAQMAEREAARDDGIAAVSVVTPNESHAVICTRFLEAGIHVICDKPLATSLADAKALAKTVDAASAIFALTHNYAGYPMVREARARIAAGELGAVRVVQVEHALGGRARLIEANGPPGAVWRTNPEIAGPSAVLGDLGVHAHHLMRFVTGLEVESLSASLATMVAGRRSHDDAQVSLRLSQGARGALWASFVAAGNRSGLRIRVHGELGGLEWIQEQPELLMLHKLDAPSEELHRGDPWLSAQSLAATRLKAGQPEGFPEAFANLYRDVAGWIRQPADQRAGAPAPVASVHDGVAGMQFIMACLESDQNGSAWVDPELATDPPAESTRSL